MCIGAQSGHLIIHNRILKKCNILAPPFIGGWGFSRKVLMSATGRGYVLYIMRFTFLAGGRSRRCDCILGISYISKVITGARRTYYALLLTYTYLLNNMISRLAVHITSSNVLFHVITRFNKKHVC